MLLFGFRLQLFYFFFFMLERKLGVSSKDILLVDVIEIKFGLSPLCIILYYMFTMYSLIYILNDVFEWLFKQF